MAGQVWFWEPTMPPWRWMFCCISSFWFAATFCCLIVLVPCTTAFQTLWRRLVDPSARRQTNLTAQHAYDAWLHVPYARVWPLESHARPSQLLLWVRWWHCMATLWLLLVATLDCQALYRWPSVRCSWYLRLVSPLQSELNFSVAVVARHLPLQMQL